MRDMRPAFSAHTAGYHQHEGLDQEQEHDQEHETPLFGLGGAALSLSSVEHLFELA
jgi:hypothetical protein